jgi:hypothetical protein
MGLRVIRGSFKVEARAQVRASDYGLAKGLSLLPPILPMLRGRQKMGFSSGLVQKILEHLGLPSRVLPLAPPAPIADIDIPLDWA